MKRYLLITGSYFNASYNLSSARLYTDSLQEAKTLGEKAQKFGNESLYEYDWATIIDLQTHIVYNRTDSTVNNPQWKQTNIKNCVN